MKQHAPQKASRTRKALKWLVSFGNPFQGVGSSTKRIRTKLQSSQTVDPIDFQQAQAKYQIDDEKMAHIYRSIRTSSFLILAFFIGGCYVTSRILASGNILPALAALAATITVLSIYLSLAYRAYQIRHRQTLPFEAFIKAPSEWWVAGLDGDHANGP